MEWCLAVADGAGVGWCVVIGMFDGDSFALNGFDDDGAVPSWIEYQKSHTWTLVFVDEIHVELRYLKKILPGNLIYLQKGTCSFASGRGQ